MTNFRLSTHAEGELIRRGIPRALLESVLDNPEQIVPEQRGSKAHQGRVDFGRGRIFLLRAIVVDSIDPHLVVTVYRTSRIAKYWRS